MNCGQRCVCVNGGTCEHMTGDCNCTTGWTGHSCEQGKLQQNRGYRGGFRIFESGGGPS